VLITCDTLRADRLGIYGYGRPTSPAVDAFARGERTVVFDEAWASSSITGPSLSSLLTGLLPDEIAVPDNKRLLPPEATSIAELARAAGYRTAAFVSNAVLAREPSEPGAGVHQGFEVFDDRMTDRERNRNLVERVAPDTAAAVEEWIAARRAAGDERFFLWVHFQDPHGPYTPPAELAARFDRGVPDGPPLPVAERSVAVVNALPSYQVLPEGRTPGLYRDRYDAEIATFDQGFARVVRALEDAGWLDGSLVVFSADHGESLGDHGYWFCHGETVYRELVRVPLVVRYPAGVARPAGARVTECVSHLDLWPTFADALGLDAPANRGSSLFAASLPHGRTFLQTVREPGHPRRWEAVSDCRWRLLVPSGGGPALFDLESDPGERRNLADREQAPFTRLFATYGELLRGRAAAPAEVRVDSLERNRTLAGLGYAGDDEDAQPEPEAEPEHEHGEDDGHGH
jgi:arylsulfatase